MVVGQTVKPNSYPCHVSPKIVSHRTYPSKHPTFPEYWLVPSKAYFAKKSWISIAILDCQSVFWRNSSLSPKNSQRKLGWVICSPPGLKNQGCVLGKGYTEWIINAHYHPLSMYGTHGIFFANLRRQESQQSRAALALQLQALHGQPEDWWSVENCPFGSFGLTYQFGSFGWITILTCKARSCVFWLD
jgi:hypothetical protein